MDMLSEDAIEILAHMVCRGEQKVVIGCMLLLQKERKWSEKDLDKVFIAIADKGLEIADEALSRGETTDVGREEAVAAIEKHKERVAAHD